MQDKYLFNIVTSFVVFLTIFSDSNHKNNTVVLSCDSGIAADVGGNCCAAWPNSRTSKLPTREEHVFIPSRLDVEMNLNNSCTTDYLESLENDFQRLVVRKTLLECPFTKLCHFSFGWNRSLSWSPVHGPCCSECSCNAGCETEKTCCPDYEGLQLDITREMKVGETCMLAEFNRNIGAFSGRRRIRAYQTCLPAADADIQLMCSGDFESFSNIEPEDFVPLTNTDTSKTYRNIHCASCNGANSSMLQPWEIEIICKQTPRFTLTGKLIALVLDGTLSCGIRFIPPKGVQIEYCDHVISDCNLTGLWERFDPIAYSACRLYETTIKVEHEIGNLYFKNPYCAICNGIKSNSYECKMYSLSPPPTYPFSQLLRVASSNKQEYAEKIVCGKESLYDDITKHCREVICSYHRTFENGVCKAFIEDSYMNGYRVDFRARPSSELLVIDLLEHMHHLRSGLEDIISGFEDVVICDRSILISAKNVSGENDLGLVVESIDFRLEMEARYQKQITELFNETLSLDGMNISVNTGRGAEVQITFYLMDNIRNYTKYIPFELYRNFSFFHDSMVQLEELMYFSVFEDDRILIPYVVWKETSIPCFYEGEQHHLLALKPCPTFSVEKLKFGLIETPDGLRYKTGQKIILRLSDYVYVETDPNYIRVCVDTYKVAFKSFNSNEMQDNTAELVVSIVAVSISVACLVTSLLTYCYLPQLRTLPGKNNMALITSLLAAQCLYLLSSFGGLETNTFSCKLVGGLTHFCWLLSVFWMNACTFHMFRVLLKTRDLSRSANTKKHVQYHVYTLALSSVFVIGNIIVSMLKSNNSDIGYGGSRCYISTQRMVEVTFGIPAAIVVTANISMFTTIVIKLKRAPTVSKNVKHERRYFVVFAKLSTITGATWLFGFVYMWTGIIAFSFLFIILNGSQGLFIMLSFTCNARTLSMFKDKPSSVQTSSAGRTKSTAATITV